ncbi:MAG: acyl-CoA thioesterase [Leptolyngbya sp. SIOISBB]|nr:acyl-CoA thioesterase [Leptolyngbya sp. SIOISBB]
MTTSYIHRRRVLFGDCDPGGIVYTPRVSHFVVEAGLEFLGDVLGGPAERRMFEMGIAPPARKLSLEFLKPMSWDDELEVAVHTLDVGNSSFSLSLLGTVAEVPVFTAELSLVCVSTESFKPVELPDEFKKGLLARLVG